MKAPLGRMILSQTMILAAIASTDPALAAGSFVALHGVSPGHVVFMRASPSAASARVGVIPSGARLVKKLGCSDAGHQHWCRVRYHGTTGWVPARHVSTHPSRLTRGETVNDQG